MAWIVATLVVAPFPAFADENHARDDAFWAGLAKLLPAYELPAGGGGVVGDPEDVGEWGPVLDWPHIPVSAANLPNGDVLTYASNRRTSFPSGPEFTYAAVWDPDTGDFVEINHDEHDMFCGHLVMLENGTVFINGGRNTVVRTSTFDYQTSSWQRIENMNDPRWYPTTVAMPDGRVFTASGNGGRNTAERWTPGVGWERLTNINWSPIADASGFESHWWPYVFVAPNGQLFHAGPTDDMHWVNPEGNGTLTSAGLSVPGSWYPKHAAVAMYDAGKLLIAGGAATTSGGSTNSAYTVDLNTSPPTVTEVDSMIYNRRFPNAIMLPSGEVLVIGGNTSGTKFSDDGTVLAAEIWNPQTGAWREVADMAEPRNYHSIALLLVNGRVLSGGGGLCGCAADHQNGQVYSPSYFFEPGGSLAARPAINAAPTIIGFDNAFTVLASPAVQKFSLIKMMATTHGLSTDLRYLSVPFTEVAPGEYQLTSHSNRNVMTPGYWMLFAVNAAGVPSVASVIRVSETGPPSITNPGNQTDNEGDTVSLTVNAVDPENQPLTFSASGLPAGLAIDPDSGEITGVLGAESVGAHGVTVTASDGVFSDSATFQWVVIQVGGPPPTSGTGLHVGAIAGVGDAWQTVNLPNTYSNMVVVATPEYAWTDAPAVTRVRNAGGSSFEVRVQNPSDAPLGGYTVRFVVAEAGVYDQATDGITMEAVRFTSTLTDNADSWGGEARSYSNAYSVPVVLGQVMSANDPDWSVFWARGSKASRAPTDSVLFVGKQVSEDTDTTRADEEIGYMVFESGAGTVNGLNYQALRGDDTIEGANATVYSYALSSAFSGAVLSRAGVDGTDGGWPVLRAPDPLAASEVDIFIDEDQINDAERDHTDEQVAVFAFDLPILPPDVPAGLVATGDNGEVTLNWSAAARADAYNLKRSATAGGPYAALATGVAGTSYTDSGLGEGLTYYYVVSAVNVAGESADSGEASATTLSPPVIHSLASSDNPALIGASVVFTLDATSPDMTPLTYSFDFGDGSPQTPYSPDNTAQHTYTAPGRYDVMGFASDGAATVVTSLVQVVHRTLTAGRPAASAQIVHDDSRDKVWNVNPDSNTITRVDGSSLTKDFETAVGAEPRSLALRPDGSEIWSTCEGSDQIYVLDANNGNVLAALSTPRGSRPMGLVFSPDGAAVYVTYMASGQLARWDPNSRTQAATLNVGPTPRAIAVTADSGRIFVGRFISPELDGEVREVSAATFSWTRTFTLAHDNTPDSELSGRGTPNYLLQMAISPDGQRLWVPSKKDNTDRGTFRDGLALTQDNTVRSIFSQLDLVSNVEDAAARRDVDDHELPHGVAFSPVGDLAFIAYQGNNAVRVFNAYDGSPVTDISLGAELAPQDLLVTPDGTRLFVMNFMTRSVSAFDVAGLVAGTSPNATELAVVDAVSTELLAADVLLGKQVFYNAADARMTAQGYISCATCHLDGGGDGRVWDFTDRGEGFRNTIRLDGRAGIGQGNVHWTGNFDEIQDFELDIRNSFGGTGFIAGGAPNASLGAPNAGRSVELDALAAYVSSLTGTGRSPYRNGDGTLTGDAAAGKLLFQQLECAACHSGAGFTDSVAGTSGFLLHDVGTIKASSGDRLGLPLVGLDTPTLRGLWNSTPYLHDGSAASLLDVITTQNSADLHGVTSGLTPVERTQLVAYLQQIDADEPPAVPVAPAGLTATPASSMVSLEWTPSPGADSYTVKRSISAGGPYTEIASGVPDPSYSDTGLINDTTYYYVVSAGNAGGTSFDSVEVSAVPQVFGLKVATGVVAGVGSSWQVVDLPFTFSNPVVVATPEYAWTDAPAVTRVRNAGSTSFELKVQNPSGTVLSGYTVHYVVVEEGVYDQAADGITMEAVRFTSTVTDHAANWDGEARAYANVYDDPVVIGQVMSENDPAWSVFWARGSKRSRAPSSSDLYVGKQVSEDPDTTRNDELIGYMVIETGTGTVGGVDYQAFVGADIVEGASATVHSYNLAAAYSGAVISRAAVDGTDGGWPVLRAPDAVDAGQLDLFIDEDQLLDAERDHIDEEAAVFAFSPAGGGGLAAVATASGESDRIDAEIPGEVSPAAVTTVETFGAPRGLPLDERRLNPGAPRDARVLVPGVADGLTWTPAPPARLWIGWGDPEGTRDSDVVLRDAPAWLTRAFAAGGRWLPEGGWNGSAANGEALVCEVDGKRLEALAVHVDVRAAGNGLALTVLDAGGNLVRRDLFELPLGPPAGTRLAALEVRPADLALAGSLRLEPVGGEVRIDGTLLSTVDGRFARGDVNQDERLDVADAMFLVEVFSRGGAVAACGDAADANDDGTADMADALFLLRAVLLGESAANLDMQCAFDLTLDDLDCEDSGGCR